MAQDFAAPHFTVGKVLATSFKVLARNIVPFGLIAAIIGIPYIALFFWGFSTAAAMRAMSVTHTLPPGFFGAVAASSIVLLLTSFFTQSAINYGTFQDLRGQRPTLGECLGRGLSTLPKVLIAAILASFAFLIGMMLLIVPGVILYLMWWVFIPVIVVEGAGIVGCFGRSRYLTRGRRWAIFGLLLLVGVAQWLIGLLASGVAALMGTMASGIVSILVTLVFTAFASVLTAVGYYYLRADKEGIAIDDIAKVFD